MSPLQLHSGLDPPVGQVVGELQISKEPRPKGTRCSLGAVAALFSTVLTASSCSSASRGGNEPSQEPARASAVRVSREGL